MTIRKYENGDLDTMIAIWNEVVEAGDAFPQEEPLTRETGAEFFASTSSNRFIVFPSRSTDQTILLACHIVRGSMCRTFTVPHPHRANKVVGDHSGEERG